MNTVIRGATKADLEAVVRLHHYVLETCLPYLSLLYTLDQGLLFFAGVFERDTVIVAESRNTIVGYCAYRDGWVDHLYLHPEYQRRGIGSRLLGQAKQTQSALQLWTFKKNAQARIFYERHGFRLVEMTDGSGNEEREPDALYAWNREGQ